MFVNFVYFIIIVSLLIQGSHQDFDLPGIYQLTHPVDHAEGPHWDARKNILYFVDIHSGGVIAYHYDTSTVTKINLNGEVTPIVPSTKDPNLLLIGLNRSVVAVEWDGDKKLGEQKILTTVSEEFPKSRFNDGKADSKGRLWWGTIGPESGGVVTPEQAVLYEITKENLEKPTVIRSAITNSNGLAWNKANNKLFYIDTPTLKVVEFDYNAENGTISDKNRTAFDLSSYSHKITGLPDGMTIDEDDNLYICLYGGGSVIKVNPSTGQLLKIVSLPSRDVTSAAWGGPNLDVLFVTTSRFSLSETEKKQFPAAGSLFAIKNLKAKGLPAFTADIVDSIKRPTLLENLLAPALTSRPNNVSQENRNPRNTEPTLWDTLMNAVRNLF